MWRSLEVALVALDLLVAFTAISGGLALSTGLERARFPQALLRGTPFHGYAVPGMILAIAVGGSAALAAALTLADAHAGASLSIVAGAVLMGWISGEILLMRDRAARSWIEVLYFALGLAMALLGAALAGAPLGEL